MSDGCRKNVLTNGTYVRIIIARSEHMYDIEIKTQLSLDRKLEILSDAAKYDVACTSSGVDRKGKEGYLGNSCAAGVCHSFAADGRCISLLKILMTNHCIYDCKYCKNRVSNDIERAMFTPEEICSLTVEFYKRNYIEGLFLSSGVVKNPDYTMEKICEALRLLRDKYRFNGYIHVKAIPGASRELLYSAGLLADRISINMELPTEESLRTLAPNKTMRTILTPMNQISDTIASQRVAIGKSARMERAVINRNLNNSIFNYERSSTDSIEGHNGSRIESEGFCIQNDSLTMPACRRDTLLKRPFAPAGQSTQMIIGATNETDFDLIRTTQALYQSFDLKRVFYSGYVPINEDSMLPAIGIPVPLLREHRLYQADFLMRYYGFVAGELLSETNPYFDRYVDPKCNWALNNLDRFPVEVNTASYDELIRVPGIGPTGIKKIMNARRYGSVTFEMLKRMRITLKRAQYFITCNGKMLNRTPIELSFIRNCLITSERPEVAKIEGRDECYTQMNLFSDFNLGNEGGFETSNIMSGITAV